MKLQNLIVIFIIIVLPVILIVSFYIATGLRTITYQSLYDSGLLKATYDAIYAFELNTTNDIYSDSDNPETKKSILKASVKMFEKSLATTCNISSYSTEEIEEYIPAIAFGLYDGFYMYAPSLVPNSDPPQYKHSLKNYVYYSEMLEDDIIIRYSLDNYVSVSGDFGSGYELKDGYLIVESEWKNNIDSSDSAAQEYYTKAIDFTTWFNSKMGNITDDNGTKFLKISTSNNPEDENSAFVQHKRKVMKNTLESVLNSTITAYSKRTNGIYRMPKLSEEDWQKIYTNISMIAFFQGKSIGLTKYNGYCVLNSTNSNEYVNPNLMYFIDENNTYHDIRCSDKHGTLEGYKIASFQKKRVEDSSNPNGYKYVYENFSSNPNDPVPLACYGCINGNGSLSNVGISTYQYIKEKATSSEKKAYYTALARERNNTLKILTQ